MGVNRCGCADAFLNQGREYLQDHFPAARVEERHDEHADFGHCFSLSDSCGRYRQFAVSEALADQAHAEHLRTVLVAIRMANHLERHGPEPIVLDLAGNIVTLKSTAGEMIARTRDIVA